MEKETGKSFVLHDRYPTSWWEFLVAIVEDVDGRLVRMLVCVVLASIQLCNVVMENQLLFGCQAKIVLCYMTCRVGKQYGNCNGNMAI